MTFFILGCPCEEFQQKADPTYHDPLFLYDYWGRWVIRNTDNDDNIVVGMQYCLYCGTKLTRSNHVR